MNDPKPTIEFRFAGAVIFPLNIYGNEVHNEEVWVSRGGGGGRGKHTPFLYVPMGSDGLPTDRAWPEKCCVVVDSSGDSYVAIDLSQVSQIVVDRIDEDQRPCLADLPHVPDLTKWMDRGARAPRRGAAYVTISVPQGYLEEGRLADEWAEGKKKDRFPLQRICSEVVWKVGALEGANDADRHFVIQLKREQDKTPYSLILNPNSYKDPHLVVFVTALCGWTGNLANALAVDFDGATDLFGRRFPESVEYTVAMKQPKTGGCPPTKVRFK